MDREWTGKSQYIFHTKLTSGIPMTILKMKLSETPEKCLKIYPSLDAPQSRNSSAIRKKTQPISFLSRCEYNKYILKHHNVLNDKYS